MLLEDLKLNMRTARKNARAKKSGGAVKAAATPSAASTFRASAPWLEFRAWRKNRPFGGALLIIIAGVELFFSGQLDVGNIHVQVGIEGLQSTVIPLMLVALGILTMFDPAHRIFYGVISLVVAVYSLIGLNLGGFFIGMLLGAIGGILIVSWIAKPAVKTTVDAHETHESHESHESLEPAREVSTSTGRTTAEPRPLASSRS